MFVSIIFLDVNIVQDLENLLYDFGLPVQIIPNRSTSVNSIAVKVYYTLGIRHVLNEDIYY